MNDFTQDRTLLLRLGQHRNDLQLIPQAAGFGRADENAAFADIVGVLVNERFRVFELDLQPRLDSRGNSFSLIFRFHQF